jgi:hypothetical protein
MINQRKQAANPSTGVTPSKTQAQTPINWPPINWPDPNAAFGSKGMSEEEKAAFSDWHEALKNTIQTKLDNLNTTIATQAAQIAKLQGK